MKYVYYSGCVIPARVNQYDLAVRRLAETFGIQLIDLEGASCCGTVFARSLNAEANLMMSLRILSLAKTKGLGIVVACPGCYESLIEADEVFRRSSEFSEKANTILRKIDNLLYNGGVSVKHFAQVLYEDVGLDKIREMVRRPLEGIRVAAHYGCHLLRPSGRLGLDNPENPKMLDRLVEATGAKSIHWTLKLWCCGSPIQVIDRNLSLSLTGKKLRSARDADADCLVTVCPSCHVQFDIMQGEVSKVTGEKYDVPVLLYPQLLGIAIGLKPEEVALHLNRTRPEKLMSVVSKAGGEGDG